MLFSHWVYAETMNPIHEEIASQEEGPPPAPLHARQVAWNPLPAPRLVRQVAGYYPLEGSADNPIDLTDDDVEMTDADIIAG